MVHMKVKKPRAKASPKKSAKLDSRDLILECATKLMAEKGPLGFTLTALESLTKLSKSHLRYYFPDLRALALQVIQRNLVRAQTQTQKRVECQATLEERPLEIYDPAVFLHRSDPLFSPLFLLLISQAALDPEYRTLFYAWTGAAETRIERLLLEEIRDLPFAEIQPMARTLHDLILGASIKSVLATRPGELAAIREALARTMTKLSRPPV